MISCVAFAAASAFAGQMGGGASGHVFSAAPHQARTPLGAPPVPTGAPPVPGPFAGYTYHYHYAPYYNGYYSGRGYRSGGLAYAIPYYYPVDNSAYGYDYVGGGSPNLYSGPPIGPDPSLHMIVEQPPAQPYGEMPDQQVYAGPMAPTYAGPMAPADPPVADVKPNDPTVLIFRNGKKQEVTNYAIMGDSLYVFDQGRKKIALADLDLDATVKANDDRGVEFRLPPSAKQKKNTAVPPTTSPDQSTKPPANIAAAMP